MNTPLNPSKTMRRSQVKKYLACFLLVQMSSLAVAQTAASCNSVSTAQVKPLLELFTSEGCDSCPPVDRWLSTISPKEHVNIMAWHVDYWDKLGWKDRFGLPEAAQRQSRLLRAVGSRNAYTPQTMVQGQSVFHQPTATVERKFAEAGTAPSPVRLQLSQTAVNEGVVKFEVQSQSLNGGTYSVHAALLENKLVSVVNAGENKGATLKHDHVVRSWAGALASSTKTNAVTHSLAIPKDAVQSQLSLMIWAEDERGLPVQSLASSCGF